MQLHGSGLRAGAYAARAERKDRYTENTVHYRRVFRNSDGLGRFERRDQRRRRHCFRACRGVLLYRNSFLQPQAERYFRVRSRARAACDIVAEEGINAFVIPSKTIPQGIVAAMSLDPEADSEENMKNMRYSLKNVKSGEVTFSIRDCELNGVKIQKDDFIGIFEKEIVCGTKDKFDALKELIEKMVDEESAILTIFLGEDVKREELFDTKKAIEEKYPDLNIDIKVGKQKVYSFLVSIE